MRASLAFRIAIVGVLLLGGAPAIASDGVAIDVGKVTVTQDLLPGGEYRLPPIGVRNPGTERSSYQLVVSHTADDQRLPAPAAWFAFAPAELTLDGGATQSVAVRLAIPASAEPGDYGALIGPQLVSNASGTTIGVGAAARVTFTVVSSTPLDAILRQLARIPPEVWAIVLAAVALVALRLAARRYRIVISRREAE